ncbi:signal peptide protein [Caballeronia fortuita]|uniref:Signal peptide protein n=1 Tax=Caballeronia fortuita TaxID=1777138 RepID=A0A157Z0R3_9BURK|nr:hypothetical protein [Caballeronia fortuita]SAK39044.1 signal peptide protein [Caballeronia fortuita]
MKKKLLGAAIGLAGIVGLAMSGAANAHVDVAVGVGVPVYAQPAVPVGYYGYGDRDERWREREWRRHEWRERRWHHEMRREERWRERHDW